MAKLYSVFTFEVRQMRTAFAGSGCFDEVAEEDTSASGAVATSNAGARVSGRARNRRAAAADAVDGLEVGDFVEHAWSVDGATKVYVGHVTGVDLADDGTLRAITYDCDDDDTVELGVTTTTDVLR